MVCGDLQCITKRNNINSGLKYILESNYIDSSVVHQSATINKNKKSTSQKCNISISLP